MPGRANLKEDQVDIVVHMYIAYLAICVPVVLFVGWTLHKNGRVFLIEIFEGKEDLADSINHLLIVGFYLASTGFVAKVLRLNSTPENTAEAIESLSSTVGLVLLVLGAAHIANLLLLSLARRKVLLDAMPQPPAGGRSVGRPPYAPPRPGV
jgi:hypothetical protein